MLDIGEYITEVERYQDDGDGYHNNGYEKLDGDWLTYYFLALKLKTACWPTTRPMIQQS